MLNRLAYWFTFFLTSNLIAIGWLVDRKPAFMRELCIFFLVQNLLAIFAACATVMILWAVFLYRTPALK